MNKGRIADVKFGKQNEVYILEYLQGIYNKTNLKVEMFEDRFSPFDFKIVDENGIIVHQYELKSRNIKSYSYPTLMFGLNKLKYVEKYNKTNPDCKFTFLWWCLQDNKLLSWDWVKDEEQYTEGKGQNVKRGDNIKDCVFVETKNMRKCSICLL